MTDISLVFVGVRCHRRSGLHLLGFRNICYTSNHLMFLFKKALNKLHRVVGTGRAGGLVVRRLFGNRGSC